MGSEGGGGGDLGGDSPEGVRTAQDVYGVITYYRWYLPEREKITRYWYHWWTPESRVQSQDLQTSNSGKSTTASGFLRGWDICSTWLRRHAIARLSNNPISVRFSDQRLFLITSVYFCHTRLKTCVDPGSEPLTQLNSEIKWREKIEEGRGTGAVLGTSFPDCVRTGSLRREVA